MKWHVIDQIGKRIEFTGSREKALEAHKTLTAPKNKYTKNKEYYSVVCETEKKIISQYQQPITEMEVVEFFEIY